MAIKIVKLVIMHTFRKNILFVGQNGFVEFTEYFIDLNKFY